MKTTQIRKDLVILHADWPASLAGEVLASRAAKSAVVVRWPASETEGARYVVVDRPRLQSLLERGPSGALVGQLAVPGIESYKMEVVVGRGGLVGVRSTDVFRSAGPAVFSNKAPAAEVLMRTLVAEAPPEVRVGRELLVLVNLAGISGGAADARFPVPEGAKLEVTVDVSPLDALQPVGEVQGELTVGEPQVGTPLRFRFSAIRAAEVSVVVTAFYKGVSVGRAPLHLTIADTSPAFAPVRSSAPVSVSLGALAPPDLAMEVLEEEGELTYRLSSPDGELYLKKFGPVQLNRPEAYFKTLFTDIEQLSTKPADMVETRQRLTNLGADLFDKLLPPDLRNLLWTQRERVRTVQVTSAEPWIPWELLQLQGKIDGRTQQAGFFAEKFELTRWLAGAPLTQKLTLRSLAVVAPKSDLNHAAAEVEFLESLAIGGRKVARAPTTLVELTKSMAAAEHDVWHFTGHARADRVGDADRASLELEQGKKLTPVDISGSVEDMLIPRPLVFLNACQSGQGGMSLTGPGGWARRFVRSDLDMACASAFIGTHWSVDDAAALEFAKAVYSSILQGETIGSAVFGARRAIVNNPDPAWLAYTVYAHPNARLAQS